jgi:hypothetical protein
MASHIFLLKNNSKNQANHLIPPHISPLNKIKKTLQKCIYYNSLRVINCEFSQHASISRHLMSCHISPLKNKFESSRKIYFFQISPSTVEK